jgi:hypothetical protein
VCDIIFDIAPKKVAFYYIKLVTLVSLLRQLLDCKFVPIVYYCTVGVRTRISMSLSYNNRVAISREKDIKLSYRALASRLLNTEQ